MPDILSNSKYFKNAVQGPQTNESVEIIFSNQREDDNCNDSNLEKLISSNNDKIKHSIFDLTSEDLDWLINLKHRALEYLSSVHCVGNEDKVDLFFHAVYLPENATPHLHITVNNMHHPSEDLRIIKLDSLIDFFQRGGRDAKELLLENVNHIFYTNQRGNMNSWLSDLQERKGIKIIEEVENEFYIDESECLFYDDAYFIPINENNEII